MNRQKITKGAKGTKRQRKKSKNISIAKKKYSKTSEIRETGEN